MQGKMRVSNIYNSPNFGKTVRVNMSIKDAFVLANCINSKNPPQDKLLLQEDAKEIFDDTQKGAAVFCSTDDGKTCYILSGEEAEVLKSIKKNALNALEAIGTFYDNGPFADKNVEYICKKEKREINNLIRRTKEPYMLTIFNDKETGLQRLHKFSVVG